MTIRDIFKKRYIVGEEDINKIIDLIESEVRKELENEYRNRFDKTEEKVFQSEKKYNDLEKRFNKVEVEKDILKGKLKLIEELQENGEYSDLAKEIFNT